MGAKRPAAGNTFSGHPSAHKQTIAGNRLICIFRTCGQMAATMPYKTGQRELIKAHESNTQKTPRRLSPRFLKIPVQAAFRAASALCIASTTASKASTVEA